MQRPNLILTDELMECLDHIREQHLIGGERFNRSAFVESVLRESSIIKSAAKSLKLRFKEQHRFGSDK